MVIQERTYWLASIALSLVTLALMLVEYLHHA